MKTLHVYRCDLTGKQWSGGRHVAVSYDAPPTLPHMMMTLEEARSLVASINGVCADRPGAFDRQESNLCYLDFPDMVGG